MIMSAPMTQDLHAQLERTGTAYFVFSEKAVGVHNICWCLVANHLGLFRGA